MCHIPPVQVGVAGADQFGYPFSFVKEVVVTGVEKKVLCREEPFVATVPCPSQEGGASKEGGVVIEVVFHGHYGEPPMTLPVSVDSEWQTRPLHTCVPNNAHYLIHREDGDG